MDKYDTEIINRIIESEEIPDFNDELPLQLQSESLKSYIDDLRKLQVEATQEKNTWECFQINDTANYYLNKWHNR